MRSIRTSRAAATAAILLSATTTQWQPCQAMYMTIEQGVLEGSFTAHGAGGKPIEELEELGYIIRDIPPLAETLASAVGPSAASGGKGKGKGGVSKGPLTDDEIANPPTEEEMAARIPGDKEFKEFLAAAEKFDPPLRIKEAEDMHKALDDLISDDEKELLEHLNIPDEEDYFEEEVNTAADIKGAFDNTGKAKGRGKEPTTRRSRSRSLHERKHRKLDELMDVIKSKDEKDLTFEDTVRLSNIKKHRVLQVENQHFLTNTGVGLCNEGMKEKPASECQSLLSFLSGINPSSTRVTIPCGQCVTTDITDGRTLDFPMGIDVIGKWHFPTNANVNIRTTGMLIQGVFQVDPPTPGTAVYPGPDQVKFTMYGEQDFKFTPQALNADWCGLDMDGNPDECNLQSKAIVIAGGVLDIQAADPECPLWATLDDFTSAPASSASFSDGPMESMPMGCTDLVPADGTAEELNDGIDPYPFSLEGDFHAKLSVAEDEWDPINQMFAVRGRDASYVNLEFNLTKDCLEGGVEYRFEMKYRLRNLDGGRGAGPEINLVYPTADGNSLIMEKLGDCPVSSWDDAGTWTTCILDVGITNEIATAPYVTLKTYFFDDATSDIDYDDISFLRAPASRRQLQANLNAIKVSEPRAYDCWAVGAEIYTTSDTINTRHHQKFTIVEVRKAEGLIIVDPPITPLWKPTTSAEQPMYAVEVVLMNRNFIWDAVVHANDNMIGGHSIVLHSEAIPQTISGIEIKNFGQLGNLGRYPLHFHMSENVIGSVVSHNIIRDSKQRCVVIHGSHNVTIEHNVAHNNMGHCYMIEDGGELDNVFRYNLGFETKMIPKEPVDLRLGPDESDNEAATFWITHPQNAVYNNIAAGSEHTGFWLEYRWFVRGPAGGLPINKGVKPRFKAMLPYHDNKSHSNRVGQSQYQTGYDPPDDTEAKFENSISFLNFWTGWFVHNGEKNMIINAHIADSWDCIRNFNSYYTVVENVECIGLTSHFHSKAVSRGFNVDRNCCSSCGKTLGGITWTPCQTLGKGLKATNVDFKGFDMQAVGGSSASCEAYAVNTEREILHPELQDSQPVFTDLTFDSNNGKISVCSAEYQTHTPFEIIDVAVEDDGTFDMGSPGFFVQKKTSLHNIIPQTCTDLGAGTCLTHCPGACLRLVVLESQHNIKTDGWQMVVTDQATGNQATAKRAYNFYQLGEEGQWATDRAYYSAWLPVGQFDLSFRDSNGNMAWPDFAHLRYEEAPKCSPHLLNDKANVNLVMPEWDEGRCGDLIMNGDGENGHYGWQQVYALVSTTAGNGSPLSPGNAVKSTRSNWWHYVSQYVDISCVVKGGTQHYRFQGNLRLVNGAGVDVECDPTLSISQPNSCPELKFHLTYFDSDTATQTQVQVAKKMLLSNGDGSYAPFDFLIDLGANYMDATQGQFVLMGCSNCDYLMDDFSLTPMATTPAPTPYPGAPTSTNVALGKPATQSCTFKTGTADKAVDGDYNPNYQEGSVTHSCGNAALPDWWMVDLGSDHYIESIELFNRDTNMGRLSEFYIEVLTGDETSQDVVYEYYYNGVAGPSEKFTYQDLIGRFVRVRLTNLVPLSLAEVDVMGYEYTELPPTTPPPSPTLSNVALDKVATQGSIQGPCTLNTATADLAIDGNTDGNYAGGSVTHTCANEPGGWWMVDLGTNHYVDSITLYNRVTDNLNVMNRLRNFYVEVLDADESIVQTIPHPDTVGVSEVIDVKKIGEYIRIRLDDSLTHALSLAEVEVMGYVVGGPSTTPAPVPSPVSPPTASPTIAATPQPTPSPTIAATPEPTPTPVASPTTPPPVSGTPTNVALNKPASQTCDWKVATAGLAVDGNTNGDYNLGSVSHTCGAGTHEWWMVDLGGTYFIDNVKLFNRVHWKTSITDRLSDFSVEILDDAEDTIVKIPFPGTVAVTETIAVGAYGQYVRIQFVKNTVTPLSLAEVEVMGFAGAGPTPTASPITPSPTATPTAAPVPPTPAPFVGTPSNVAQGKTASQACDFRTATADLAVDGNTNGDYRVGSVTHTCAANPHEWWMVDLGEMHHIDTVKLFNRSNTKQTVMDRLSDFSVEVMDDVENTVVKIPFPGTVAVSETFDVGASGQYVRIKFEKDTAMALSLAEVQIMGYPMSGGGQRTLAEWEKSGVELEPKMAANKLRVRRGSQ